MTNRKLLVLVCVVIRWLTVVDLWSHQNQQRALMLSPDVTLGIFTASLHFHKDDIHVSEMNLDIECFSTFFLSFFLPVSAEHMREGEKSVPDS